jgi:hypothetical protein
MTTQDRSAWSTLDPWEKAAKWIKVAPELAPDLVAMAKMHADHRLQEEHRDAEHRRRLETERATHDRKMDTRLWWTHMATLAVNGASLLVLAVLAARFGKDALVPALTVLGAGGGLTAGSYIVSSSIRRAWLTRRAVIQEAPASATPQAA